MSKTIELSDQEYAEFLEFRAQKLERQIEQIRQELNTVNTLRSNLTNGNGMPHIQKKNEPINGRQINTPIPKNVSKESIGWKHIIDDLLKNTGRAMTSVEMIDLHFKASNGKMTREAIRRSLSSALNTNSKGKNPRYIKTKENGMFYFGLNPALNE